MAATIRDGVVLAGRSASSARTSHGPRPSPREPSAAGASTAARRSARWPSGDPPVRRRDVRRRAGPSATATRRSRPARPASTIEHDWDGGMRASGSHTVTFDGVELPAGRAARRVPDRRRGRLHGAQPRAPGCFMPSASLGIAEAAHAEALATLAARTARPRPPAGGAARRRAARPRRRARGPSAGPRLLIDDHHERRPRDVGSAEEIRALFAEAQATKAVRGRGRGAHRRPRARAGRRRRLPARTSHRPGAARRARAGLHAPAGRQPRLRLRRARRPRPGAGAALHGHRCRAPTRSSSGPVRPGSRSAASSALAGRDHVLVERGRVGERWRARWASLTLLTPTRLSRLPGDAPPADPGGFMTRDALVARLDAYAASFAAPVVDRVPVCSPCAGACDGFVVDTDRGAWRARRVVVVHRRADRPQMPRGLGRRAARCAVRCTRRRIARRPRSRTAGCWSSARGRPASRSRSSCGGPAARSCWPPAATPGWSAAIVASTRGPGWGGSASSTGRSTRCPTPLPPAARPASC